jgi:hypothetical protein
MLDRLKANLIELVRVAFPGIDYQALYPARVVAQNVDGTLELQPDSARLPGLSHIPIRLGIPGASVKVSAGARVLVGFAGGSPAAPIATLWEAGGLVELAITATTIKLGEATPAFAAALAERVEGRLAHLEVAFNAHLHTIGPPVIPAPLPVITLGPVAIPGVIPVETITPGSGVVGTVASSSVKVKG